jgi:hypothetical protein
MGDNVVDQHTMNADEFIETLTLDQMYVCKDNPPGGFRTPDDGVSWEEIGNEDPVG